MTFCKESIPLHSYQGIQKTKFSDNFWEITKGVNRMVSVRHMMKEGHLLCVLNRINIKDTLFACNVLFHLGRESGYD